jgi:PGF-CTERM protein
MKTNKVVATLIAILFLMAMIGTINIVNAKEYTRNDYTITLSERCEWIGTHDRFYGIRSDCQFHCDRKLKINIWVNESFKVPIPDGHPISSLQDVIDFEHELFYQPFKEKEITNTYQMTTRNGYDVYVVECIPDSKCLERRYYIPRGDETTCIIECRTWKEDYDEMISDICEPAVQSFKFTGEPTPTPSPDLQSALEVRRILYQNYGKCLNDYYWVERGNEMGMMFGDDFERSFTTPLGILETFAKQIIIGGYSAVETLTKEVTSGTGTLNCYWMSTTLQLSKPEITFDWEEPEQRMLHILELIEEEKYEEAKEEICNLRSVLTVWRDNIDTLHWTEVGFLETAGEANKKRAKNLLTAIIQFLDTEYAVLGGEVIPSPTPTPTPNGPGFEAVFGIVGLLAVAYLLRRGR